VENCISKLKRFAFCSFYRQLGVVFSFSLLKQFLIKRNNKVIRSECENQRCYLSCYRALNSSSSFF